MLYQRKDIIASKKQPAANSCKGELRHIEILSVREAAKKVLSLMVQPKNCGEKKRLSKSFMAILRL